jgi:hypothetical protein
MTISSYSSETAKKIINLRNEIVTLIKNHEELGVWTEGRVYKTDMHLISATSYPCITIQMAKNKPAIGSTQGFVKKKPRLKIRAYSQINGVGGAIDEIADEQIILGSTIEDLVIDNYNLNESCDNSDWMDTDYMYLKNKQDQSIFLQCVEITIDCTTLISRKQV